MKMCTQIETLLNKFMERAILLLPPPLLFPFTPTLSQVYLLISTKALTGKPTRQTSYPSPTPGVPQHTHSTKHAHQRSNLRRKNKPVNLAEKKRLCLSLTAPVIFCQSSLLSNFKAVLIVAGLKIRFHCGGHF